MVMSASSMTLALVMVVVGSGMGLYCMFLIFRRQAPDPPVDTTGFRPGEGVLATAVGKVLSIDAHDNLRPNGSDTTVIKTSLTTHDRLLVEQPERAEWFDASTRPTIRNIGRIMWTDASTFFFVRVGRNKPSGATPKRLYNFRGIMEDVHVIELAGRGRLPLRFEAVESVVVALYQWAQADAPISRAPQPFSSRATPPPEHSARAYAKTQLNLQAPPSSHR